MGEVTSAVAMAVVSIQAKYKGEMFSLQKMIKKFLLLRESPSATFFPDSDSTLQAHPGANTLPNISAKRWNQAALSYFNPYYNKTHEESKMITVGKNV